MKNEFNTDLLAQLAMGQMEETEVGIVLARMLEDMPCEEEKNRDFDRFFAANRLSKANGKLVDKYKKAVLEIMVEPNNYESKTIILGSRMFKLYYNDSCDWSKCHIPEKKEEEKTEKDRLIEKELAEFKKLNKQYEDAETKLNVIKQKKKSAEETLAGLMPKSKCIKHTPVLQALLIS